MELSSGRTLSAIALCARIGVALVLAGACVSRQESPKPIFVALVADGSLIEVFRDLSPPVVACARTVAVPEGPGQFLAIDSSRGVVYALLVGNIDTQILSFDRATRHCTRKSVFYPGLLLRALVRAPASGRIIAAASGDSGVATFVIDPTSLTLGRPQYVKRWPLGIGEIYEAERYPAVSSVAFTPSERFMLVSYLGQGSGTDWIEDPFGQAAVCPSERRQSSCVPGMGLVQAYRGDSVAVVTSENELRLLDIRTGDGRLIGTGLPRRFQTEFLITERDSLFFAGFCARTIGYSAGNIRSGAVGLQVHVPPVSIPSGRFVKLGTAVKPTCGGRLAISESDDIGLVRGTRSLLGYDVYDAVLFRLSSGNVFFRFQIPIVDAISLNH
jgi:hypothetical protein